MTTKIYNPNISVSQLLSGAGVSTNNVQSKPFSWNTNRYHRLSSWQSAYNEAKFFYFDISPTSETAVININKCNHLFLSRTGSGPTNLAFVHEAPGIGTTLIADLSLTGNIETSNVYSNFDYGPLITEVLSANPVIINNAAIHRFYFIPYNASAYNGGLRVHDEHKVFKDGVDISFDGSVTTSQPITRGIATLGTPSYTPTATPDPLAPNTIYVSGAGLSSVNGTYLYQLDYYANTYSYYNSGSDTYIASFTSGTNNKKWFISTEHDDFYISTLSGDYPIDLSYEVFEQGVSPAPLVLSAI